MLPKESERLEDRPRHFQTGRLDHSRLFIDHRGRPKENPSKANPVESQRHRQPCHHRFEKFSSTRQHPPPLPVKNQRDAMHPTPNDKCPRCSMPQTSEKHRQQKIAAGKKFAPSVAAKRDIEVVA